MPSRDSRIVRSALSVLRATFVRPPALFPSLAFAGVVSNRFKWSLSDFVSKWETCDTISSKFTFLVKEFNVNYNVILIHHYVLLLTTTYHYLPLLTTT